MARSIPASNGVVVIFITLLIASPLFLYCGCNQNPALQQQNDAGLSASSLEQQATSIIQQALASNKPQVRTNAIEVAAVTNKGEFMPSVQLLLRDEFVPVRFAAAVAIGDTRYRAAGNDVAQLLKDNEENVKIAAAYAVYKLNPAAGYEIIRKAIASPDQRVRANAAFLLGKIDDKAALPLLYDTIRNESSDDRVRLNSIEAIARLGDERIYQKTWAMLISAYADDRVCGIRTMGALGTPQAKDAIMTMLKDDLPEVRLVAAEQLGSLGDTSGEKVVLDALTQGVAAAPDQESRDRINILAAISIGQIRTPAVKKFLPGLLKNESQFVRLSAAKAVFQCAARDNIGR